MTMSMYSSYTPEDFNNIEEDIFGEYGNELLLTLELDFGVTMPDRSGIVLLCVTFQIYESFRKFSHTHPHIHTVET